jgi:class 3 adenylate cyclase
VDIAAWLRRLGLERYEQAFRDNAIDREVLPELSDADLQQLGILLGHRKRLLKAIAELGSATDRSNPAYSEPVAERRQLTVMFVDLVGSTALASRLDPEDLREIIGAYHRCAADTIARFGGFVAKYERAARPRLDALGRGRRRIRYRAHLVTSQGAAFPEAQCVGLVRRFRDGRDRALGLSRSRLATDAVRYRDDAMEAWLRWQQATGGRQSARDASAV